jgi:hypothetical protein
MAVSNAPWDGSASRFPSTEAYCSSCLIDENAPGEKKVQDKCHLPVHEPNGDVNANGVHAAVSALAGGRGGVGASPASKKKAARALIRLYGQINDDPPPSLKNMAS